MESWTKLARIVKVTKNLDFVADFVTKSFFASNGIKNLVGTKVCLVPPVIDVCRFAKIIEVSTQQKHVAFTLDKIFECEDSSFDNTQFVGKYLMIKQTDLERIFNDLSYLDLNFDRVIGLEVVDKQLGHIGCVKNIDGTDIQKHLIVKGHEEDVLIPYVDDIVLSVDDYIEVNLPVGLICVNK